MCEIDFRGQAKPMGEIDAFLGPVVWSADNQPIAKADSCLVSVDDLAFILVAAFRQHGHISNVLTHISRADRAKVEEAIRSIVNPLAVGCEISPLAENILELLCADRGITGRIMKPFFQSMLTNVLGADGAAIVTRHVDNLFQQARGKARNPSKNASRTNDAQLAETLQ